MSGSVGKILEVAAVAAAAYFTAGGSLAASGAADASIGAAGAGTAAGYGGAALGGISDVAGGALYTEPAAAGFGGAATAGTIGAGLAAGDSIGTGLAADGTFSGTLATSDITPALTGTVTSPYSTPTTGLIGNVTPASGITNSTALAPTASNPFSSALDWLSGHKGQALGAGKILAALYAMQGPSAQQRALLAQMNQNSQSLQQIPASQANLTDAQLQAIERSEAAGGYLGSGKMMADIASGALGQQLQVQQYNNSVASAKQALLAQQLMSSNESAATTLSALGLLGGGIANMAGWKG